MTPPLTVLAEPDPHVCDPTLLTGCLRCSFPPPQLCCDLHHPAHFESQVLKPASDTAVSKKPRRSKMPKKYQRPKDAAPLVQALKEWRDKTTSDRFGPGTADLYGGCLTLPSDILDRIVDCACINKIQNAQDVIKETDWDEAQQHAEAIFAIVREYAPVSNRARFATGPGTFSFMPLCCSDTRAGSSALRSRKRAAGPSQEKSRTKKKLATPAAALGQPSSSTPQEPRQRCKNCRLPGHNGASSYVSSHK